MTINLQCIPTSLVIYVCSKYWSLQQSWDVGSMKKKHWHTANMYPKGNEYYSAKIVSHFLFHQRLESCWKASLMHVNVNIYSVFDCDSVQIHNNLITMYGYDRMINHCSTKRESALLILTKTWHYETKKVMLSKMRTSIIPKHVKGNQCYQTK